MDNLLFYLEVLAPAFVAGLLVLATHILLGREVLDRGIVFLDLAVAQMAALGVILAASLWYPEAEQSTLSQLATTLVAILVAVLSALALYQLRHLAIRVQEALIGIMFVLAATGSVLLLSKDPHGGERLKEILVGQILWLDWPQLLALATVYAVLLAAWVKLGKQHRAWYFYPMFAVCVTLSTQFVGVYLVFASLIIPNLVTLNQSQGMARAMLLGIGGYGLGLLVSSWLDLPSGAAVVWCLTLVAAIYFVLYPTPAMTSGRSSNE